MPLVPSDLELPYQEWNELAAQIDNKAEREWLAAWNHLDLALSPMNDKRRRKLRCGHWWGWTSMYADPALERRQKEWCLAHRAYEIPGGINWWDGEGWVFQGGGTTNAAVDEAMGEG